MAEPGSRRLAALSFNKNIFCIVSLLLLVYTGQSLGFEDEALNRLMTALTQIKERIKLLQKQDEIGTDTMLLHLDVVNATANKNHLNIFQQYLQQAVDEAHRQKIEKASAFAASAQLFNVMTLEHYSRLQQLKRLSYVDPMKKKLFEVTDQIVELCRSYLELKKDVFTGKTKETKRKLEYTLKNLCFWRKFYAQVEIAKIFITLLFCIVALYWVCCHNST